MAEPTVFNIGLRFCIRKCRDKQESPPTFLLSNKGKGEKNRKRPFFEISEYGGKIMEREGVSTLSIHGFPWALRHLFIFEIFFRVCVKKF